MCTKTNFADGSGIKWFAWTNGVPNDSRGAEDCLQAMKYHNICVNLRSLACEYPNLIFPLSTCIHVVNIIQFIISDKVF